MATQAWLKLGSEVSSLINTLFKTQPYRILRAKVKLAIKAKACYRKKIELRHKPTRTKKDMDKVVYYDRKEGKYWSAFDKVS